MVRPTLWTSPTNTIKPNTPQSLPPPNLSFAPFTNTQNTNQNIAIIFMWFLLAICTQKHTHWIYMLFYLFDKLKYYVRTGICLDRIRKTHLLVPDAIRAEPKCIPPKRIRCHRPTVNAVERPVEGHQFGVLPDDGILVDMSLSMLLPLPPPQPLLLWLQLRCPTKMRPTRAPEVSVMLMLLCCWWWRWCCWWNRSLFVCTMCWAPIDGDDDDADEDVVVRHWCCCCWKSDVMVVAAVADAAANDGTAMVTVWPTVRGLAKRCPAMIWMVTSIDAVARDKTLAAIVLPA